MPDLAPAHGGGPRRALIPTWQARSGIAARLGGIPALHGYLQPSARAARSAGLDVRVADLSQVHGDIGGLWVGGDRIDVDCNQFVSSVVTGSRALNALRAGIVAQAVRHRADLDVKPSSGRGGAGSAAGDQVTDRQWLDRPSSKQPVVRTGRQFFRDAVFGP